jgi:cyclophilin family peptidyl-prolyl cis-trans isomerase
MFRRFLSRRVEVAKSNRFIHRPRSAVRSYLEQLEDRMVLAPVIPTLATMTLTPTYTEIALPVGKTFQLPIDGSDTDAGTLSYSVSVNNSNVTATLSPTTNRSIEIDIDLNNDAAVDGTLVLHLFDDLFGGTRLTNDRIVSLIMSNFYDNLTFHRVIQNFVIQGGDPAGNGTGGSNIDFADEYVAQLTFTGFGQLAMANSGDDSNDSQFFITDVDLGIANAPRPPQNLNFNHTIFGQLVEGFNIVAQIIASDGADANESPDTTIRMLDVRVINDTENAVVRLAPVGAAGTQSIVTVRATNTTTGLFSEQTFTVNVVNDTDNGRATTETTNPGVNVDDRAFLVIPESAFPNIPTNLTTNEDTPVVVSATDLETTGNLTVRVVNTLPASATGTITASNVANLTVSIDPVTRNITLTPAANFNGTLDFFLAVRDETRRTDTDGNGQINSQDSIDALGNYDTQHIVLTVNAVNDAPIANSASGIFRNDGSTTTIQLVASDGDPEVNQTLTFEVVDPPDHGMVTISATGLATYTPDGDFQGRDSFTYRVRDNGGTANGGVDTSQPAAVTLDFDASMATLRNGVLTIVGGAIDDAIDLEFVDGGAGADEVDVVLNGADGGTFLLADITSISIQSFDGDDVITIDVEIDKPSQIETGDGNDDVTSGDGDDLIDVGDGDDVVDAGDGMNTIFGRKGIDDLTGGDDDDLLKGGKGDDAILDGGDGDDTICGGTGDDLMEGGEGDDRMFGNEGDDDMSGSEGDDCMKGGYGTDTMDGGDGDDKLIGGPEFQPGGRIDGPDSLTGGEGADTLRGGAGNDSLDGGEDDDRDVLRGGDGEDVIERVFGWADRGRAGVATFLLPGAPRTHPAFPGPDGIAGTADDPDVLLDAPHTATQTTPVDYTGYSNPPTYGPHHPSPLEPSGVYTTEQDDATMVHNLEHGEIWISYDPAQLTVAEINRLTEFVRSFGEDSGIFLTPRAANDDARPIAVASWGRLQTLTQFNAPTIRRFIDKNQGTGNE